MQIEHLYYFLDVVRTLSISQSAKDLYISPQGLSQAIKSLEKEYNIELFDRTKHGFILTGDGEKFAVCTKEFLKCYEDFKEKSHNISPISGGKINDTFSIYTTALFSVSGIILDMVNIFSKNLINSKYLILEQLPFEVIKSLKNQNVSSIGLVNIPSYALEELTFPEELTYEYLLEIGMVANVSPNSVYAKKKFFTKQELVALPLCCFKEPLLEDCIRSMLEEYGEPNIVTRSSNIRLAQGIALSNDIVSLSVNLTRNLISSNKITIPIHDTLKLSIIVLYHNSQKENSEIKTLVSLIKSYLLENFQDFTIKEKPNSVKI
ncbi:transcriptional regulator [Desulfitobacterium dehalogenans ATCC 51507]|uniref:Transcriptional regulator n=1 Tax=Desulfitobacterium dehalogenans (strain ATCC 51507 / DSM 9161 / JW/IU-DC1) TaxID=756499 RepID=I4A8F9_DESDJ|nr:LysR family transcriptional regulator [Desulfitobacterium dehalogenans]AFM00244.1 transcriptional regulator [Desulfitobacterium dehalogenans ATCC 51507]